MEKISKKGKLRIYNSKMHSNTKKVREVCHAWGIIRTKKQKQEEREIKDYNPMIRKITLLESKY